MAARGRRSKEGRYRMNSIEDLVARFSRIATADGSHWSVNTLVPDRLHLSRGESGGFAVFLEGAVDTFGTVPSRVGTEHSDSVVAMPSGRTISALRLGSDDPIHGNRVI